jgi:Large polyvalent protein associated domain 22
MPSELEALVGDLYGAPRRDAQRSAIAAIDEDPDAAGRALEMEKDTGVPAQTIALDPENFEARHQAALVSHIVGQNPEIQEYINSHPMAAKVSTGDWGNLDDFSNRLHRFTMHGPLNIPSSVLTAAIKGFKTSYGDEPYGEWVYENPNDAEWIASHPNITQALKDVGTIPEMAIRGFGGVLGAFHQAAKEGYMQLGGSEEAADSFAREAAGLVEFRMLQHDPKLPTEAMKELGKHVDIRALAPELAKVGRAAEAYVKAGEEPPYGLHPAIDDVKKDQAKQDLDNLDEALQAAVKSQTRERSAELFTNFVRQHTQDTAIGVDAEAIAKLYGDKTPEPDDGILGWVPGLAEQVQAAREYGGKVEIPLADWLGKVDPEVAKALHDDIQVRPGHPTLNEAKEPVNYAHPPDPLQVLADEDPISLARKEAGLDRVPYGWGAVEPMTTEQKLAQMNEGETRGFDVTVPGTDAKARFIPTEELTAHEAEITDAVNRELRRIAPEGVTAPEGGAIKNIAVKGREVRGMFRNFQDQLPLILWSLDSTDPLGTARHEAIHHLRQSGFFKPEEWKILTQAARDQGWIEKYDIKSRYPQAKAGLVLEEAVAEGFKDWKRNGEPPTGIVGTVFAKLSDFLDRIKASVRRALGYDPTWEDIFHRVESGEIGSRQGTAPLDPRAFREPLADEPSIFEKAKAVGMTEEQYRRWGRAAEKRMQADQERSTAQAAKEIKRRMTKEYQDAKKVHEEQATKDVNNRPDIIADEFLRLGRLGDQRIKGTARLKGEYLTKEQKAGLNEFHWDKHEGLHPDDVAGLAGYTSGEAMINRLMMLEQARKGQKPYEYKQSVIKAEVDTRLKKQFGNFDEKVMAEAREHAVSQTQYDMLHEEILAAAQRAGAKFSITKEQMKAWAKEKFDQLPVSQLKMVKFLELARKHGDMAEQELLKGNPVEGFRAKQMQGRAFLLAQEAKRFEKSLATFERTAKRFSKRTVDNIPQEYTDRIHEILNKVGRPIGRSQQDLAAHIAPQSFADWIDHKRGFYAREVDIADFLTDPAFRRPVEALTGEQADAMFKSVANLVHNARDEGQIIRAGNAQDLEDFKKELIEQIATFPEKKYDLLTHHKTTLSRLMKKYGVAHLQIEALLDRWDRGDPMGPWSQGVMRELTESANREAALEREFGQKLKAIKDDVNPNEAIPNTLFHYQNGINDGDPIRMTRSGLRAILLNVGNSSNLEKLARGYRLDTADVMAYVHRYATKQDWDWAQKVWDVFADLKAKADIMYRELAGIEPEAIPVSPIQTPHGTYAGGYYPIIYDHLQEGTSEKLMGGNALEQQNYVRATTPQGYTKARTGYIAPLDLTTHMIPNRIKSMIHDIAFRRAVVNASKVFYARDVRAAITRHIGDIQRDMLVPYLKDVANASNYRDDLGYTAAKVSEFFRQNVISTMIGWNPGTVLKHGPTALVNSITEVGPLNFANAVRGLFSINEQTGESNWQFAMNKSEELQRRHQNWTETIGGGAAIATGEATTFQALRQTLIKAGATPVAISDLLSSVPTWLAKYKEIKDDGGSEGDAIHLADRAVRRAHGSTVITNRPAIMRSSNPLVQWTTSLYGFFSHVMNRQYELMWRSADALDMAKKGDLKEGLAQIPKLTTMFFSYIVFPAMIEELVTPMTNKEHESWGLKAAKTLTLGLSSSWPIIRDIVYAALNGKDPAFGLASTAQKTVTDLVRDLDRGKEAFGKPHAGKLIRDGATALGALTGLVTAPEGKAFEYMHDYAVGLEHPKGPWGVATGLRFGTMKGHSPTAYDRFISGRAQ